MTSTLLIKTCQVYSERGRVWGGGGLGKVLVIAVRPPTYGSASRCRNGLQICPGIDDAVGSDTQEVTI